MAEIAILNKLNVAMSTVDSTIDVIAAEVKAEHERIHADIEGYQTGMIPANAPDEVLKKWAEDRKAMNNKAKEYNGYRTKMEAAWKSKLAGISAELGSNGKDSYGIAGEYKAAVENIDSQLEIYEERAKAEKMNAIKAIYFSTVPAEMKEHLPLERILSMQDTAIKTYKTYADTWMNKGYTVGKIEKEMTGICNGISMAITSIKALNHQFEVEGLAKFWDTLDMNAAIAEMGRRLKEQQEFELRMAEQRRREREEAEARIREEERRKAVEEQMRILREQEEKRAEEIRRIRAEEQRKAEAEREEALKRWEAERAEAEAKRKQEEEAELAARWAAVQEAEEKKEDTPAPVFSFNFGPKPCAYIYTIEVPASREAEFKSKINGFNVIKREEK